MKTTTIKPAKPAPKRKPAHEMPAVRSTKAAATRAEKAPPKATKKAPPPPPPPAIHPSSDASRAELPELGQRIELDGGLVATAAHADQLIPSRFNAKNREPDTEMVASIEEHGVIEPLVVRPVAPPALDFWISIGGDPTGRIYEIVCGEKRWKGAQQACRPLVLVIVRELTDQQVARLQFIENFHRSNLTPLQEADAFVQYEREFGEDAAEIGRHVKKPASYVAKRITVGKHLPDDGREALRAGRLLLGAAVEVACLPDAPPPAAPDADRLEALSLVLPRHPDEEPTPVREARERIIRRFHMQLGQAPFATDDATLCPSAGACGPCPKKNTSQLALFQEGTRDQERCLDRRCWEAKTTAAWQRKTDEATARGLIVLDGKAEGAEGTKARNILSHPIGHGMIPLNAPCDLLHEAKVEAAQARFDEAEEKGDEAAKAAAEAELDALENAPDDGTVPTWGEVLGKAAQPVALGRFADHAGRTTVHELVNEKAALRALQERKVPLPDYVLQRLKEPERPERPERPEPRTRQHELDQRKRELRRERLTAAIVTAGEEAKADVGFWRALVHALARADRIDMLDGFAAFLRRRSWPLPRPDAPDEAALEIIASQAAKMPQQKLRGLVVDLACLLVPDEALASFGGLMGQDAGAILAQADKDAAAELAASAKAGKGAKRGTCRFCACTAERACELPGDPPTACAWTDDTETICSVCALIVELAGELVSDGQRCDHCETAEPCEHVALELHRRAEEQERIAGTFEQHKARIGACLGYAVSRAKKPARKKGAKNATNATTEATT